MTQETFVLVSVPGALGCPHFCDGRAGISIGTADQACGISDDSATVVLNREAVDAVAGDA